MLFLSRIPRPPLHQFIESIWMFETPPAPHALQRILPNGKSQLIINLKEDQIRSYDPETGKLNGTVRGTALAGVQTRFSVIDMAEQEQVMGVVFRPGGTRPFLRIPAWELSDRDVELDSIWDRGTARTLRERLLETEGAEARLALLEQILLDAFTSHLLHPAVEYAVETFVRRPLFASVGEVTDRIGLSPKRFIERFKTEVGYTPKQFCRILRFQQVVTQVHRKSTPIHWAEFALDCGYFDQAHFIHDFRSFSGMTPTAYQAAQTDFSNHVNFLQSDPQKS